MPRPSTLATISKVSEVKDHSIDPDMHKVIEHEGEEIVLVEVLGKGAFGVVYRAKHIRYNEDVALKQVKQDSRYKNRELDILKLFNVYPHENVITLLDSFYTYKRSNTYLNLVLELIPETLHSILSSYKFSKMPESDIKCYMKQVFRALRHLNSLSICHRDIKPHNLLVNPANKELKLADFGSAKIVKYNEPNVSYICSRFYRAPELVLGATLYDTKIDVWAAGCVLAELYLGSPIFAGKNATDQLVQIFSILGVPSSEDLTAMNPSGQLGKLPTSFDKTGLQSLLKLRYENNSYSESLTGLLHKIFVYNPMIRLSADQILSDTYFN